MSLFIQLFLISSILAQNCTWTPSAIAGELCTKTNVTVDMEECEDKYTKDCGVKITFKNIELINRTNGTNKTNDTVITGPTISTNNTIKHKKLTK